MNAVASNEPRAWSTRQRWTIVTLVFLVQCGLILIFGARQPNPVRAVTHSLSLQLADSGNEFIALNDPTLFALPHAKDFGAAKRNQTPYIPQPSFAWSESPRWLPLAGSDLLNSFGRFMETNPFSNGALDFKPEPVFSDPTLSPSPVSRPHSILVLRGDLAARALLQPIQLTNWPEPDVIAASKVQVLVNAAGQVVSAVLLPPDSGIVPADAEFDTETRDDKADQRALELARAAKFAPIAGVTMGQMIFNWRAVPIAETVTNAPPKQP